LRTALTEMRDRTFIAESGKKRAGTDVIGTLWDLLLTDSLGARREAANKTQVAEVELALDGNRRRAELLEGFHERGTVRP
jgi:hypothetical protein